MIAEVPLLPCCPSLIPAGSPAHTEVCKGKDILSPLPQSLRVGTVTPIQGTEQGSDGWAGPGQQDQNKKEWPHIPVEEVYS